MEKNKGEPFAIFKTFSLNATLNWDINYKTIIYNHG